MLKISWLLLLSTLLFTTNSAMAKMQNWQVAKVEGEAVLSKPGFAPRKVQLHDSFGAGQKITTSGSGTVSLIRNSEAFIISPNSEIEIPSDENTSTFTLFFQTLGTVLFSAKKKKNYHFKVLTPFAAALVKGTTFAININKYSYQIQVFEGSVELTGHNRKDSHIVKAGNKSLVTYQIRNKIKIKKVLNYSNSNLHLGNNIEKLSTTYRDKIVIGARGKANLQKAAKEKNDLLGKGKLRVNVNLRVSGNFNANGKGNLNRSAGETQQHSNNNGGNKTGSSNNSGGNSSGASNNSGGNSSGASNNSGGNSSGASSNSGGNSSGASSNSGGNSSGASSNSGGNSSGASSNSGGNSGGASSNSGGNSSGASSNSGGSSGGSSSGASSNSGGNSSGASNNSGGNSSAASRNSGGNSSSASSNSNASGNKGKSK